MESKDYNPSTSFNQVVNLIQVARNKALQSVNVTLISLYWQILSLHQVGDGQRIS